MISVYKFCLGAALSCAVFTAHDSWATEEVSMLSVEETTEIADTAETVDAAETALFEISSYSEEQISDLLPLLEEWVQKEFVVYPYLWVPPKGEMCLGNTMLVNEKNALVTVVRKDGEVVGVATGVAFDSEVFRAYLGQEVVDKTIEKGFDPSKIVYMSYFLTAPEYRNNKDLVEMIYNNYLDFAQKQERTQICFFEGKGRSDHPLKPENPMAIEPWGYVIQGFRSMDLDQGLSWPTLQPDGSVIVEVHEVEFFIKEL